MKTKDKLIKFKNKLLDILFPKHIKCIFCGEELNEEAEKDTCASCLKTLPFITRPCLRCGEQLKDGFSNICVACNRTNRNFVEARSVMEYTSEVVALVHKFKYSNKLYLAEPMVKYMSEIFATWSVMPDYICDVPIHANKMKKKKYNHSSVLAKNISENFGIEYLPLCEKIKDTVSQTTLTNKERRENVIGSYAVKSEFKKSIKNKTILIVDDVITTCATIDEIANTLNMSGAKEVYALSFAHTSLDRDFDEDK